MREDHNLLTSSNEGFNFKSTICNGICLKTFSNQNGMSDLIQEEENTNNLYHHHHHHHENTNQVGREIICQFLKENETNIKGQCVLELGSFSSEGLCGIYACKMGCMVVMTESQDNIPILNENIRLNDCSLSGCAIGLNWGIQSIPQLINCVGIPFDFIMASDIIIPSSIESALQLFSLVSTILKVQMRSNKDCYFVMSYVQRDHITTSKTLEIADRFGLKYSTISNNNIDNDRGGILWRFDLKV